MKIKPSKYILFGLFTLILVFIISSQLILAQSRGVNIENKDTNQGITARVISQVNTPQAQVSNSEIQGTNSATSSSPKDGVKETDESYFKRELNLPEDRTITKRILAKLSSAKLQNSEKMEKITRLARVIKQERRERISEELLLMDDNFLERFEKSLLDNIQSEEDRVKQEKIKQQLENYIETIETNKEIKLLVEDSKIKSLFESGDVEKFMNSLF